MTSKFNSLFIRLFFILIFISATSVAYLFLPNEPTPHPRPPLFEKGGEDDMIATPAVIPTAVEESLQSNTINNASVKGSFANSQDDNYKPTAPTSTENFETATLTVNDQNYTLQFNTDENLLTAMRRLETSSTVPFVFVGREYAGLGFFVDEINGLRTNPNAGKYWIYYVNGEPAKIGISNYLLKSGDIIKWTYENSKF